MKTDTVNTAKWKFEIDGSLSTYTVKSTEDFWICGDVIKADAELITTAVNACKEINRDNPLNAARAIPDLLEALKSILNCNPDEITALNAWRIKGLAAIKQATK